MSSPNTAPYRSPGRPRADSSTHTPAPSGANPSPPEETRRTIAAAGERHLVLAKIVDDRNAPVRGARCAVIAQDGRCVAELTTGTDGVVRSERTDAGHDSVAAEELPQATTTAPPAS
jgi:hypothetical protein